MPTESKQWILAEKPHGLPTYEGSNPTFKLTSKSIPDPTDSQVLLKSLYISNDPAQRGWIGADIDPERLYVPPVEVGQPMRARCIAQVVKAGAEASKQLKEGAYVLAGVNWSEYAVLEAKDCNPVQEIQGYSLTHFLGALGLTGMTAYSGLLRNIETTKDDIVVVSGAAGATGSMVVQVAKKMVGCKKVIGLAGTDEKCRWVEDKMGADVCINYKSSSWKDDLTKETGRKCGVYFDNVGGETLDHMLTLMARHGRVSSCGAISSYNSEPYGIKNYFEVIMNRIQIKGFIVLDYMDKFKETTQKFVEAAKEGKLTITDDMETVVDTKFEDVPKTWLKLFEGGNQGKLVTKLV